jgi:hypothetical protein
VARKVAALNRRGIPVFLRFAHEMNGSWYAWSRQPVQYISAFRLIAEAVHRRAPYTAMVWAPNYGGGYPFSGGVYEAAADGNNFNKLDTNSDGVLTMDDDPYGPYYPGDDAVDWFGMSIYHWGTKYPWGENELPEPGKFLAQLTGEYVGTNGDERALPDFHAMARLHSKPLAITETAAFYSPTLAGSVEDEIKRLWWQQSLNEALPSLLPQIRMINWFEWSKYETEVEAIVNWGVSKDAKLAGEFKRHLPSYLRFAQRRGIC